MNSKRAAIDRVRITTDEFLRHVDGVSVAQWHFKETPEQWSLADTVEHVAVANQLMLTTLTKRLLLSPLATDAARVPDDALPQVLAPGGAGPNTADPTGRWPARTQAVSAVVATRDDVVAWAEHTTEDLRQFGSQHVLFGVLDGVQWLLFIAAHTAGHTRQLNEIKARRAYPVGV
jgi:hypothetical protein